MVDNVMECLLQKFIEWVIVVQLECYYIKEEILIMYFNKFDFLNNVVGIKIVVNIYFLKELKDLSIEEVVILVGMCKNLFFYNLKCFNECLCGWCNVVFGQMWKVGYLIDVEIDLLKVLFFVLKYCCVDYKEGLVIYFCEYLCGVMIVKELKKSDYCGWQMQKYYEDLLVWKMNLFFGWCVKNKKKDGINYNIYIDGFKIYIIIDLCMQKYVEEVVYEYVV